MTDVIILKNFISIGSTKFNLRSLYKIIYHILKKKSNYNLTFGILRGIKIYWITGWLFWYFCVKYVIGLIIISDGWLIVEMVKKNLKII